ncbi:MAG: hypothetical protein EBX50_20140 [Chitinophagia bacterium]|nr:hypothetical protein [Chitinophagia bacterium]
MSLDPISTRKKMIDELLREGAINPHEAERMKEIVDEHLACPTPVKNEEPGFSFSWKWIFGLALALSVILISVSIFPFFQDSDQDGISNYFDLCVDVPGTKVCNGCPDQDLDSIQDMEDVCPAIPGYRSLKGCSDFDLDGVVDAYDDCPMDSGEKGMQGCKSTTRSTQTIRIAELSKKVKKCKLRISKPGAIARQKTASWVANNTVHNMTVLRTEWKNQFSLTTSTIESNWGIIHLSYCKEKGQIYYVAYSLKASELQIYCSNGGCFDKNGKKIVAEPEYSFDFQLLLSYLYKSEVLLAK